MNLCHVNGRCSGVCTTTNLDGSGGYNAALIAEVVGPEGEVTTIDIDAEIVHRARAALHRTGYPHVRVIQADGEYGYPSGAPYDAIIITVEAAVL